MAAPKVVLDAAVLRSMGIARADEPPQASASADQRVNGLSFSDTGALFVTSHRDGALSVYDGATGRRDATYFCRDSGCKLVTFTHSPHAVLHVSNSKPVGADKGDVVQYHDLFLNKITRTFVGHTDRITSLSVHPITDTFLTTSVDGTFRLWDLRQEAPIGTGKFTMPPPPSSASPVGAPSPIGAFDCSGKIFGIATPGRGLALYDSPNTSSVFQPPFYKAVQKPIFPYTVGPTRVPGMPADMVLPPLFPTLVSFTGMEFSPDATFIALNTADRGVLLLSVLYPNKEYALLNAHPVDPAHPSTISFTPDGRWLTVGGVDGHVYSYDVVTRKPTLPVGADTDFFWRPGTWDPTCVLVGEAHKGEAPRAAAWAAGQAFTQKRHDKMHDMRRSFAEKKGKPLESVGAPLVVPSQPPPLPASAEEQVSRHEGPVTAVRWHPKAAVLVSTSRNTAVWCVAGVGGS